MRQNKQMTIIALNPNGIRAYFRNSGAEVKRMIAEHDPDIIIWNEIKGNEGQQKEIQGNVDVVMEGTNKVEEGKRKWNWFWNNSQKAGRHGLCISVKSELAKDVKSVRYGFCFEDEREPEGRIITLEFEKFFVVGIYTVNAGMSSTNRLEYKLEWLAKLAIHAEMLRDSRREGSSGPCSVMIMGDWNVAPENIDIHNPAKNQNSAGFTKEEREAFKWFMNRGWIDVYRHKYPNEVKYTFWNAKFAAREKGVGWRIDHVVVNQEFAGLENSVCEILDDVTGSDHAPVMFQFEY